MSSRDRDFRPSRRRGFDDDNFETPRRSFGAASGSNAQRFEAPSGPPIQAVVKWYNSDKGFGFVQLADGSGDALLTVSVVERTGHGNILPGATLEVRAGAGPKGPQVSEILSVDSSTAQQEPARRARPERPMARMRSCGCSRTASFCRREPSGRSVNMSIRLQARTEVPL